MMGLVLVPAMPCTPVPFPDYSFVSTADFFSIKL